MAAVVVAVEAAAAVPSGAGACRSKSSSYLVRSLYWRLRAGLRRLHQLERRAAGRWRRGTGTGGGRFSFHYDALSYALNFDDGGRASADFSYGDRPNDDLPAAVASVVLYYSRDRY